MAPTNGDGDSRTRSRPRRWTRWALWATPRPALVIILVVEAAVTILTVLALSVGHASGATLGRFALLVVLSGGYAEAGDRVERFRRYLSTSVGTMASPVAVWCFAAGLTLPPGWAALFVVVLYGHTLLRARRHESARPHRLIFTAATVVLATLVASAITTAVDPSGGLLAVGVPGAVGVLGALLAYIAINQSLVSIVIYFVRRPAKFRTAMLSGDDLTLEVATLVLALLTAEALVHSPLIAPLVLAVLVVLHRSSLVRQLERGASTDAKTGLLNAASWRQLAQRQLRRVQRGGDGASVLMVDLDHFKRVNDTYGHLAGDTVLRSVADTLARELRGHDAVGRFGGEEFVVLLDGVAPATALNICTRLNARIRELTFDDVHQVTASIGLASYPADGHHLDDLIEAADAAMYRAKDGGRDQTQPAVAGLTA
jgi:diguanylate cyclase (GGDEF)-like protein